MIMLAISPMMNAVGHAKIPNSKNTGSSICLPLSLVAMTDTALCNIMLTSIATGDTPVITRNTRSMPLICNSNVTSINITPNKENANINKESNGSPNCFFTISTMVSATKQLTNKRSNCNIGSNICTHLMISRYPLPFGISSVKLSTQSRIHFVYGFCHQFGVFLFHIYIKAESQSTTQD